LIVSLMTLRRHYKDPVTVFLEGEHHIELVDSLKSNFDVDIIYRPDIQIETGTLVHKIEISMETPYDLSVWIDSDTIIVGGFEELFEMAKDYDLVTTNFANWQTSGRTISKRIKRYQEFCSKKYIQDAINYGPAINTGIYAWKKDSIFFKEWLELAKWGDKRMFIADEVACQVLLPQYNCKVADLKYNVSVLHDPGTKDQRIIHYHGKKHCKEAPKCLLWLEEFEKACKVNLCNIQKYIEEDKRLRRFLSGRYSRKEKVESITKILNNHQDQKNDVTIVTACDPKYVEHLKITLPNWIKFKNVDQYPFIIYVNGFEDPYSDKRLEFLKVLPRYQIIKWDMPQAESQRERMLSAFVMGTAKDVKTPYWMKIDADAFATNQKPLIDDEMKTYVT
jgi:hypothetical protein